jgi:hypothetical protein
MLGFRHVSLGVEGYIGKSSRYISLSGEEQGGRAEAWEKKVPLGSWGMAQVVESLPNKCGGPEFKP